MPRKTEVPFRARRLPVPWPAWVALCALLIIPCSIKAQETNELPRGESAGSAFKLGVQVDLVVMHTSVFDKDGHFVTGLEPANFRLHEDGKEQEIVSFAQEDVPLTIGILLDTSGSMRQEMEQVNNAALAFIEASHAEDEVFLIGFNDEVELLQDYTSDIDEIRDSLDNTVVAGGTVLYDAIYLGVQKAQAGSRGKKAVVVITDGEDKDSYYKLEELLSKVQEADVQVFCVGFIEEIPTRSLFGRWSNIGAKKVMDALNRIAEETGGKAYFPQRVAEIHAIVAEIARELRTQYSIGYVSSNGARDGSFRRVKISLAGTGRKDLRIRHRRGYYAASAVPAAAEKGEGRAPFSPGTAPDPAR